MYQRHVGAAVPVAVAADIDVDDEVVVIDVPSSEGGWMLLEKKDTVDFSSGTWLYEFVCERTMSARHKASQRVWARW